MRVLAGIALICSAISSVSAAGAEDLPAFQLCMDHEIARYERALRRAQNDPRDEFNIGGTSGVDLCGTFAIMRCDQDAAPYDCQRALRRDQDALQARVLADLPAELPSQALTDLYNVTYALAHGSSAGPDCAGQDEPRQIWCEAREANRRLASAILVWQIARFTNDTPKATQTGWANIPPPMRPLARPIITKGADQ